MWQANLSFRSERTWHVETGESFTIPPKTAIEPRDTATAGRMTALDSGCIFLLLPSAIHKRVTLRLIACGNR